MFVRLNGISFVDLPYIRGEWRDEDMRELMTSGALMKRHGEPCIIVHEEGEKWDLPSAPAYSVEVAGLHVGYIPRVETLKEEQLRARDGYRKQWKPGYANLSPSELCKISAQTDEPLHEWRFVGKTDEMRALSRKKEDEASNCFDIRDRLRVMMEYNKEVPTGWVRAFYFDAKEGMNHDGFGEVCSLYLSIDGIEY